MSKRKPIYILRMDTRAVNIRGRLTIEPAPGLPETQGHSITDDIIKALRRIGIEATPKQVEVKR